MGWFSRGDHQMNTITINGQTISSSGNIIIRNGKVTVDGKEIANIDASEIVIHGSVEKLDTDLSVNVNGIVHGNINAGGSVNCDEVKWNVIAGGSVNCDDVGGSVTAGGSVRRS